MRVSGWLPAVLPPVQAREAILAPDEIQKTGISSLSLSVCVEKPRACKIKIRM